jgi:hypothetical protein
VEATKPPLAAVEMGMPRLMDKQEQAAFGAAVARTGELAAEDRFTEAVRAFAGFLFTDEEVAMADDVGYFDAAGRYIPNMLNFFQQQMEHQGPLIRPCSSPSPLPCWCCPDRTRSLTPPPARGTWPTTYPTHGYRRSPAPGMPPP